MPKMPPSLETADENAVGVVAAVFEGAEDAVDGIVVEPLKLVPVGPPEKRAEIGLVEDAPCERQRSLTVAVDEMAGDGTGHFMPLGEVLGGCPAPAIAPGRPARRRS